MYRHLQTRFLTKALLAVSAHLLISMCPLINLWDFVYDPTIGHGIVDQCPFQATPEAFTLPYFVQGHIDNNNQIRNMVCWNCPSHVKP